MRPSVPADTRLKRVEIIQMHFLQCSKKVSIVRWRPSACFVVLKNHPRNGGIFPMDCGHRLDPLSRQGRIVAACTDFPIQTRVFS